MASCGLHSHEEQTFKPQNSCNCQVGVMVFMSFQLQEAETGDPHRRLAGESHHISELWLCLRDSASMGWLPTSALSFLRHVHTSACVPTYMQTDIYTHHTHIHTIMANHSRLANYHKCQCGNQGLRPGRAVYTARCLWNVLGGFIFFPSLKHTQHKWIIAFSTSLSSTQNTIMRRFYSSLS